MQISLLLPHQLFYPNPALSKSRPVVIARDPLFIKDKEHTAIYHKQKILLHLMSTESYCQELKSYGYRVSILDENQIMTPNYYENYLKENNITEVHYIEPHDYLVEKRLVYGLKKLGIKFHRHDTPGFINTKDEINEYFSTKKKLFLSSFYQGERKKLNILVDSEGKPERGKWSFDSENRKKLPKKIDIPSLHKQEYDKSIHQNSLKHILDNYGKN